MFIYKNIININSWLLYFFKYLDNLPNFDYVDFIMSKFQISDVDKKIINNLIVFIKMNIQYIMNDISIIMNNLYSEPPNKNPNDKMTNYSPPQHGDLSRIITVTFVWYRGQIPTIHEIFDYIYKIIDNITISELNQFLKTQHISDNFSSDKYYVTAFYKSVLQYFKNVYENIINGSEFVETFDKNIYEYVENFLTKNLLMQKINI